MLRLELLQLSGGGPETAAARLRLFLLPSLAKIVLETLRSQVTADAVVLSPTELHGADRSKVQSVRGNLDQIFRAGALGKFESAILPHLRDVVLPSLAHATNKTVRPTQQQNVRPKRVSPRQDGQIL